MVDVLGTTLAVRQANLHSNTILTRQQLSKMDSKIDPKHHIPGKPFGTSLISTEAARQQTGLNEHSYSIPLVFFSFLGLEAVTVTAIEVRNVNTSRWPSRYVAYVVFVCYMLCVVSYSLNISWQNANLQRYGEIATNTTASQGRPSWVGTTLGSSYSPLVLISMASNQPGLAGFFQGACVFSVISAANTSLYLASRTFYGLCLDLPDSPGLIRGLKHICTSVRRSTSAPLAALLFCVTAFFWLPFLHFQHTSTVDTSQVQNISSPLPETTTDVLLRLSLPLQFLLALVVSSYGLCYV